MGADNTEKQGHSAFPALLPFRHLASTKGCYVTAIYTRAPFPSHPPSHVRQHHMQTKCSCSAALLQVLFLLSFASILLSSNQPPLSLLFHLKESLCTPLFCNTAYVHLQGKGFWRGTEDYVSDTADG